MGTSQKFEGRNPKQGIAASSCTVLDAPWVMNSQVQELML